MAFFRRALAHRLLDSAKTQSTHSSSSALLRSLPSDLRIRPAPLDSVRAPERAGLEGLWWDPRRNDNDNDDDEKKGERGLSMEELRKVLRAAEMETARSRLRATRRQSVSYDEFLGLCNEASGAGRGPGIARSLDESGDVVVLGNVVFLHPDQIAKAIQRVLPLPRAQEEEVDFLRTTARTMTTTEEEEELAEMEKKKAEIDKKAEALVKRELWCGLGFIVLQTLGFMRLTFWELSWDVMEPICFFVTSSYFMAGYGFFLRTSKEPSFESLFQRRFAARQKRLMEELSFDLRRFEELTEKARYPTRTEHKLDCSGL